MNGRPGAFVDLVTLPEGVCLLDTEAKMLQAMEDMLPLVTKLEGFRDNNRWSINSSVSEVFHSFYVKLITAARSLRRMEYFQIKHSKGTYKLSAKVGVYFEQLCEVMPLYYLPELEKVNKELYDLLFYMVVLLKKQSHVGLWDEACESYAFQHIEEQLAEYKTYDSEEYKNDIWQYQEAYDTYNEKGPATLFYNKLIKAGASKRMWLKCFAEFNPKTPIAKDFYKLLKLGKELIEMGESIDDYVWLTPEYGDDPENYYQDELPALPNETARFLWRVDDVFYYEFESMEQAVSDNTGSLPFYMDLEIEDFNDVSKADDCFAAKLLRFMKAGRELESKYKATLANPEKLKKAFTPKPKPLIDIL